MDVGGQVKVTRVRRSIERFILVDDFRLNKGMIGTAHFPAGYKSLRVLA